MKARSWGGLAILLASVLTLFPVAHADPQLPVRTGAVVDAADIVRPYHEDVLAARAAILKSQSNVELVVVTLRSLQGYTVERWGRDLGNRWRVGGSEARGVLLIVAPNDRQVRIEVGDGLASMISDGQASSIIDNVIVPQFRGGEMSRGIAAGAEAIADAVARASDGTAAASPLRAYLDDPAIQKWGLWGIILALLGYRVARYVYLHPDEVLASFRRDSSDDRDSPGRSSFFSSSSRRSRSSGRSSRGFRGRGASGRW